MAKSKGRLLAELLASDGKVKESKSALDIAGGKLSPSDIPTLPNSKLENSSISIAGHSTSLGGSVTLNTGDIDEHTNYKYYTDARVRAAISASGDLSYNSSTGVISFSATASPVISVNSATGSVVLDTGDIAENGNLYHTTARARGAISATGSLAYNSTTGVMSFTMPAQNTSNITEGTNKYYTDARVGSYLSTNGYATQSTIVGAITDSAPATLDTLNELAAALGDDANFSTTVTNSIGTKWTQNNTKIGQWDTAYGWGNHANAGYLTSFDITTQTDSKYLRANAADTYGNHTLTIQGVVRSTNNANTSGPNFNVSTTNKSTSEYAYRVDRSGSVVGGIRIDGRLIGPEAAIGGATVSAAAIGNWNTAYGWGNHASAGYLTSFDITTQTDSKYLRSNAADTASETITFSKGINVGDLSNGGITGSNYNITGVNTLVMNDPGEGIQFAGTSNVHMYAIDDANDSIINLQNASELRVNNNKVWTVSNDGSGSGLDADLLDGQQLSYVMNYDNLSNKPTNISNSDTVDGLHAASFLRSDATDTFTNLVGQSLEFDKLVYDWTGGTKVPIIELKGATSYGWFYHEGSPDQMMFSTSGNTNYELAFSSSYITHRGNTIWHAGNDGSGSGLDADTVDGYQVGNADNNVANKLVITEGNGYISSNYFYTSSNNNGTTAISRIYASQDGYIRYYTPTNFRNNLGLWWSGNDGSGSGLDADTLDGYQKSDINPAHSHYRWTGISASGTQARRFVIMRLYGCPAHWDSNWQDIHFKVWSESYEATNLKYQLTGDYGGAGTQANMFQLRLKDAGGSSEHGRFRLVLGTPVDAGWDHSGQNTYYVDVYAEASHYMQFTVAADFYSAGFNVNTLPTSGGATSVVYSSPTVSNITTFNEAKEHSYFANHKIWNDGNHGSASGLDADLLDGQHASAFLGVSAKAADSNLLDGLDLHTGRNDQANKVVRTNSSGYIDAGWINTTSGARTTQAITRVYASDDSYLRYYTLANFGSQIASHINYNSLQNKPTIPSLSGYATETYVNNQITSLVDSSPAALNTLNELAAAIGDDANFSTTVTNNIATKLPKAGGTVTGDLIVRNGNANAALHFRTANDFVGIGFNRNVATGAIFDSNINAFQMHIQNNKLEFETYNGSGTTQKDGAWILDTAGNQSITGTMLVGGQYSNNSYSTVSSTRLLFGGGNDPNNYFIGTNLENYGGNYTKLDLRWHTGIRMGAQAGYGGIRFFNNEDLGSVLFSIGKGDTNMRVEGGNMLFTGDRLAIFGPNTGYSKELAIGGNGNLSTANRASIGVTNGNLHIDAATSSSTYLNFYDGTGGTAFGNGAGGIVAWMGPDGDLWKGSSDNSGSKYWHAGNDGSGSGLDADTLDGQQGSYYEPANSTIFKSRGSVNVTTSSGGSNSNPFDDAHTETKVAEYGARLISYTGASATMLTINTGGSASVFQIGAHYNGNEFYMRTRTDSSNWQTWKKLWHAGNDGLGSGLDADMVDGKHKDYLMHYKGQVSGNWDTMFSQTDGHMGVYQVSNITNTDSNYPSGAYTYGGVMSWQLDDSTFKLYAPHVGQLHYQTGWNNDEYSGWRKIWDTGNDGSGSGLDADLLDGQHGSYYAPASHVHSYLPLAGGTITGNLNVNGTTTLGNGNADQTHINDTLYLGATDSGDSHFYFGENSSNWYGDHWYWDSGHEVERYSRHAGTDTLIEKHNTSVTHKVQTNRAYERLSHSTGYQIGSYNSVTGNSAKTNPIYTIGDNYRPSDTSVSGMYGIGYAHSNLWGTGSGKTSGWGQYVVEAGAYTQIFSVGGTWSLGEFNRNGNKVWDAGNDGSGSGLDADTIDSIDSSRIIYGGNATGTYNANPTVTSSPYQKSGFYDVHGSSNNAPTNTYYSYINMRHTNTSNNHGHQIAGSFYSQGDIYNRQINNNSYGSWSKIWNTTNDGSGSGLDADTLDGQHASAFLTAETLSSTNAVTVTGTKYWQPAGTATSPLGGGGGASLQAYTTGTTAAYMAFHRSGAYAINWGLDTSNTMVLGGWSSSTTVPRMSIGTNGLMVTAGQGNLWGASNDGSGSGLDADLLDGQQGSYYAPNSSLANYVHKGTNTGLGAGFKMTFHSGSGGATFSANHYSMGIDVANGSWNGPNYSDLIIGYHTGIRMGAGYSGIRFYNNSPTSDTNNTGNGNGSESLLMTIGGGGTATGGANVTINNALTVGTGLTVGGVIDANGGHGAINITNSSILSSATSTWTGNPGGAGKIQYHSNRWYIVSDSSSNRIVQFRRDGSDKSYIANDGTFVGNVTGTASGNWSSSNDGSSSGLDADLLDGRHLRQIAPYQSSSDFVNGTLVTTDINSANTNGDSFVIEITGKAYGSSRPHSVIAEGYIYNNTIINTNGTNIGGSNFTYLKVMNISGNLCFWWPRHGYWNSYDVHVRSSSASTSNYNRVTAIANSVDPSSATKKIQINLATSWTSANDASGSGLDADTVDGIHGASFLRGDQSDTIAPGTTYTFGVSNTEGLRFTNSSYNKSLWIGGWSGTNSSGISRIRNSNDNLHLDSGSAGSLYLNHYSTGNVYARTNLVWHAGNDAAGSGLDADLLDGIQGASFLRSDTADTFTGTITMGTQQALVANNYGRGVFGLYSSTRYQHVWSMGTAYKTNDSGTSYGNMYGLTYTHTNVGTGTNQSISGLSHQLQHRHNGTLTAAIGSGIWTSGNVTAYSDIAVKTNLVRIPNALEKVCSINGYTYERTDYVKDLEDPEAPDVLRQAGVVAQEIEKVLPEVVSGKDGNKAVAYGNVVALLIESIKELKDEVDELKKQLKEK